jgi:hypothetical protein
LPGDSVSAARAAEADCGRLREIAPAGGQVDLTGVVGGCRPPARIELGTRPPVIAHAGTTIACTTPYAPVSLT